MGARRRGPDAHDRLPDSCERLHLPEPPLRILLFAAWQIGVLECGENRRFGFFVLSPCRAKMKNPKRRFSPHSKKITPGAPCEAPGVSSWEDGTLTEAR